MQILPPELLEIIFHQATRSLPPVFPYTRINPSVALTKSTASTHYTSVLSRSADPRSRLFSSFSLVHPTWAYVARPLLFREIILWSAAHALFFAQNQGTWNTCCRKLTVAFFMQPPFDPSIQVRKLLISILRALECLDHIVLDFSAHGDWISPQVILDTLNAVRTHGPRHPFTLEIRQPPRISESQWGKNHIVRMENIERVQPMLGAIKNVHELILREAPWAHNSTAGEGQRSDLSSLSLSLLPLFSLPHPPKTAVRLNPVKLTISQSSTRLSILHAFTHSSSPPRIQHLAIGPIYHLLTSSSRSLIQTFAPISSNLKSLSLHVESYQTTQLENFSTTFISLRFPLLRSLELKGYTFIHSISTSSSRPNPRIELFRSLPPNLEELKIAGAVEHVDVDVRQLLQEVNQAPLHSLRAFGLFTEEEGEQELVLELCAKGEWRRLIVDRI
ncbi:hypothetical protein BT69DRAFT_1282994 [Atractiella rhizophila]|nr:hypothetical protein BT69DRAFT_1282994 [Atractiella rhizophila]